MNNDVLDIISEYLSNISSNIMEYQEQVFCLWSTEKEKTTMTDDRERGNKNVGYGASEYTNKIHE